ncbi:MAG: hypothetical protein RL215_418 [Planctomycetota bacterium]|jgi:lysophospholipid acyltransferase (LPLAT)-like uncharacterized protein
MKIRSRILNIALSWIATLLLRLLFLTVRIRHFHVAPDATPYKKPQGKVRYTFSMWHDQIVLAVFSQRTWNLAGLISQHRDGGYLADSVRIAGIQPVRGSTSRGGLEAVREILSLPDLHLAMTPDGPRGPRRQMKDGILYIASRSERPLVPAGMATSNAWHVPGNWTDLTIPKPFSTAVLIAGTPVLIPKELEREQMPHWSEALTAEMHRLDELAQRILRNDQSAIAEIDRSADPSYFHFPQTNPNSTQTHTKAA